MTTLISADLHLNDSPRDHYRHVFVRETLPALIDAHKVDRLIILGDLTDAKDRHSAMLVNLVVGYIFELRRFVFEVIILRGNHDYLDPSTPFFHFLRRLEGVRWINQPTRISSFPLNILALPHTQDYKKDWAEMRAEKIILAHNTFTGAVAERGKVLKGIPLEVVSGASRVISGDVHIPQKLGNVIYVGAPYTIDFGDSYSPRVLLLTDQGKLRSIPVEGPRKRLLEPTWPNRKIDRSWIEYLKPTLMHPGDILKFRIRIEPEQVAQWRDIRDQVREWGTKNGFHIFAVSPVVEFARGVKDRDSPSRARKSDVTLVEEYVEGRGLDGRTLGAGLKIMEKN